MLMCRQRTCHISQAMGSCFRREGDLPAAKETMEFALEVQTAAKGAHSAAVGDTCNSLAIILREQGKDAAARPLLQRDLGIKKKSVGTNHLSYAATLYNVALMLVNDANGAVTPAEKHKKFDAARAHYATVIRIRAAQLGPNHSSIGQVYLSLGSLHRKQDTNEEAIKCFEKALAILIRTVGPFHHQVASTYNNMAIAIRKLGRYDEALKMCEKTLAIKKRLMGEEHASVARTYISMGVIKKYQNKFDEAMSFYAKAIAIQTKALGPNHNHVGDSWYNMGNIYQDNYKDTTLALGAFRNAARCYRAAHGVDHADTLDAEGRIRELQSLAGL